MPDREGRRKLLDHTIFEVIPMKNTAEKGAGSASRSDRVGDRLA
jgi:hypothetical protein